MNLCEQLKEEYLKEVTALINGCKENSVNLRKEGSEDEAILETIKANVYDIFYKMFNVSYNKSCKGAEPEKVELDKLSQAYYEFFEKIPANWREHMIKDKEHNMMEDYYKEEIKLETMEKLKDMFTKYYDRFKVI